MTRARWMWVVVFVAAVGCGGPDAVPQQAPPATGVAPDHETLGKWPNVVVSVNDQETAADRLFEIMKEAETALTQGQITPAQLAALVPKIAKCGRDPGNLAIDAHAKKLSDALTAAKARDWGKCNQDLEAGH